MVFSFSITLAKEITLQLSWFNQFQFAGYYIAKEKGFYKEEGLNVNIKPFEFGLDIPQGVHDGKYDFAIGRETLILEKANKKDIVALYALFQASPLILISTKKSGINKITDFNNKNIMTTIDDAGEVSIKAMITSQKLNIKDLNFIKHTHNINDLIEKKTDVISAYTSKAPYHLLKRKIPHNIFSPKDYGFDMYSDLLYTSEKTIQKDLETVSKFKRASLKGWEYAFNNINETIDLILSKYNTQKLTHEELFFEAKELKKLSYYKTDLLGDINFDKLQRIYDLYNVMGLVNNKINLKTFVLEENDFLRFFKSTMNNLSKYVELPYIYFFISLFFILIILIIYKQIILHQTTRKLLEQEKKLLIMNDELKQLSIKDSLTNLYNRRYFESIAKENLALARRENNDLAIIMIDIDNFKKINDTYGHQTGDQTLILLASLMTQYKRGSDIVSRYGGEEFVVLLPNTSLDGAKVYADNLRKEVEKNLVSVNNHLLNVTISLGLTIFNDTDTIDSALDRADNGLYHSKKHGKNKISIK